jgi:hypothetical protein
MPGVPVTITKATVVQWKADPAPPAIPTNVVYDSQADVSLKAVDRANNPDNSPIVAQHIMNSASGKPDADRLKIYEDLLGRTRDGLLTVTGVTSVQITAPNLPLKQ